MLDAKVNTVCRICKSPRLYQWLDLGLQPLANSFLKKEDLSKPEPKFPLRVCVCEECSLSQLIDIVNPSILFRNYVYFSSVMPKVSEHWGNYAAEVVKNFVSSPADKVLEIGSNDGVLLGQVQKLGAKVLGVDPAQNIARQAVERGIPTIAEFFGSQVAKDILKDHGKFKVIIANNVVAHIDDHQDLLTGVCDLLAPDGVFVFEAPYLVDMFENLTFDTIYHEHMSQLSLKPLKVLLESFGLEIFDAKTFSIQGNSIRVYASKKGVRAIQPGVAKFLKLEKDMGLDTLNPYQKLAEKISKLKNDVCDVVKKIKKEGKRIAAYGAPAKGNTLLNYYGIGSDVLDFATEALQSKIGFYTPGTRIPVVDIAWARKNPPDYYFLLAWNYEKAVLENEKDFTSKGGKFILPVSQKRIVP